MAYNDLNSIKKINGIPVDLNFYSKVIENDSFFKTVEDADENLAALDRNIIPVANNLYSIGEINKVFNAGYFETLISDFVNLSSGTILAPSLSIGSVGLASLNANELSVIASGLESLKINSSGLKVKAANNFQLAIENTLPGSLSTWFIGNDENGFRIASSSNIGSTKLNIGNIFTESFNRLKIPLGTALSPSIVFEADESSGFYKSASSDLSFSINASDVFTVHSNGVKVQKNISLSKLSYSTLGLAQEIDVSNISKIIVDTYLGDIEFKGFTGGQEGQMLYIYKRVPLNTFGILFDDATATQKVLLRDNSSYLNTATYGGITLSFDDGVWREVSRS